MDPVIKRQHAFARVWATLVAGLLLLQMALAGAAVAAQNGQSVEFGVICSTQSAAETSGQPVVPHRAHRHGLCCILHCGALAAAPPPKPLLPLVVALPSVRVAALPATASPEPRVSAKRAAQSPRAPPAQS